MISMYVLEYHIPRLTPGNHSFDYITQDLQDDLTDLMLDADEIQEVMSRSYGLVIFLVHRPLPLVKFCIMFSVPDGVDEDDLMDELAALEDTWEGEGVSDGMSIYVWFRFNTNLILL